MTAANAGEMKLGWESIKGFLGKLLQAVVGFVGTIVFARLLGPTSFGGFYLLLSIVFIADRPIRGFGQAVRKRFSQPDTRKSEIVGCVLLVNAVVIVLASTLSILFAEQLVGTTGMTSAPLVFIVLFASLAFFFPFQKMLGARGWIARQTWNDTLRSVLTFPLQLAFVFAGLGAAGMGYGLAAATFTVVPIAAYFIGIGPSVPTRETVRSLWEYAKYSTPSAFVGKAYDRFDVLLIGAILSPAAVGYYEVAYKLTVPATFLASVISSGIMPKVSHLHSRDEDVSTDVVNAVSFVSILSIPIFFGAFAIPRPLVVTAYGPEYSDAAALLVGLALYWAISSQTQIYTQTLQGMNLPDVELRINATTLAVNVVIGFALIFAYGPVGVVVATVIAEALRYALAVVAVRKRVDGLELLPRPLVEQVFAGLAMFVFVEGIKGYVPLRSWFELSFLVGSGAVVYGLVLLVVSEQLRFTLLSVWGDATS